MNFDDDVVKATLNDLMMDAGGEFTLTKAELAEVLFAQVGLNKREAKEMVEAFFEEIRTALEHGDIVKLSGFGNFSVRDKASRPGRNPKTGEMVPIAARRVVTFHASQKFKAAVEGTPAPTDSTTFAQPNQAAFA
ncbi:integration host factor subunit alpha [Formosimonas limnophila]|jgi:integration host factor subunit alpha|uniref:Integration host factor subunit alpha n=2 Tax=Formosimonas limnophila TaxID=1384487 RepID=A0A8J3CMJ4_9BURK|nr:integration host factor subunit alpha [Formosimonas limnophila]